ncbi:hypothetical protein Tco_1469742, partial [Tanacetum coccineum]
DPYEAIMQAYLDGTDTESEPFEDTIDTETLESPLAIAPPIPLSESTAPVLVPILYRTTRMAVRIPPVMSSGLSTSMAGVAAMSKFTLCNRVRSSYESLPSVSPPDLPLWKRYRGTSELVEDSEEEDDEEDEEIVESMDSDSVSEDVEDDGPTAEDEDLAAEDEDPAVEDEGLTTGVEGPSMDNEGYGLVDESRGIDDESYSVESDGLGLEEGEEAVPGGQRQAALVVGTTISAPLGLGYGALRRHELALDEGDVHTTPAAVETVRFLTELGAQVKMQGGLIYDHAVRLEKLPPALFERSLEYKQERVVVTFGAGENQDVWLQLTEERHIRFELAEVVDGMRRGQEPRG